MLLKELQTDRYFTMALGFLDLATGDVRFVQAGHPNPIILRADGSVEELGDGGMPIGLLADVQFPEWRAKMNKGDRLLLYSDGLTECPSANGVDMLDEEGLVEMVAALKDHHGEAFLEALRAALEEFAGTQDFPDDVSALLLEY